MSKPGIIVLGGTGLIGTAVCECLARAGHAVVSVNSKNYASCVGARADVLINCNGNTFRYKASQDPQWDFAASVTTVEKSLFDFKVSRYFYISTIDVYDRLDDPVYNHEDAAINLRRLHPYAFHKWLGERLVEQFAGQPLILRTGTVLGPGVKKGPLFDLVQNEPLHISPDSKLSLIDTATIAEAIVGFVAAPPPHRVINLTGTGSVKLREPCAEVGLTWRLAPGAEQVEYHYPINNARLRGLFPVQTSHEMATRFLTNTLNKQI